MDKIKSQVLITVSEAEATILAELRNYGSEKLSINHALNRILAQPFVADRDFPPFDRVTMDGIAIKFKNFKNGNKTFKLQSTQAAGEPQQLLNADNECIEVMTGAILPENTDTIIRYEDLEMSDEFATINTEISFQQNIHFKGEDRKKGTEIVPKNTLIRPAEIAIAASIGAIEFLVKKLPKIAIITSGDELVGIDETPELHQIRTSNVYAIASILDSIKIKAEKIHIPDNLISTENTIQNALNNFDILILSGGVSMGKKDFIPMALEKIGIQKLFHKIAQTPGKPFWFGKLGEKLIFALPGNPVSTYLCMVRYVLPWLNNSLNANNSNPIFVQLAENFSIKNSLTYFLQVKLSSENARLVATPIKGHGSGDFANMVDADGFLELPAYERNDFKKGEVFKYWPFFV